MLTNDENLQTGASTCAGIVCVSVCMEGEGGRLVWRLEV